MISDLTRRLSALERRQARAAPEPSDAELIVALQARTATVRDADLLFRRTRRDLRFGLLSAAMYVRARRELRGIRDEHRLWTPVRVAAEIVSYPVDAQVPEFSGRTLVDPTFEEDWNVRMPCAAFWVDRARRRLMKLLLQEPDAIALRIELDSMFAANRIPGELLVPAPPRVQDLLRPLDEPCFDYRLVIDDARLGLVADAASRGEVTDSRASRRTTVDTGGQAGA